MKPHVRVTCAEIKTGTEAATYISLNSANLEDYRLLRKDFHFEVEKNFVFTLFFLLS